MPHDKTLCFGVYRLAGPHGPLWRDNQVIPLAPKILAVLWTLVQRAGQVVPKATLLDTVWADTTVSDAALTTALRILRRALGEDPKAPCYIATVHRLGYRFVAAVQEGSPPPPVESRALPTAPLAPSRPDEVGRVAMPPRGASALLLGRDRELRQLRTRWALARSGYRQVVLVTGEAGIGKTAVVDAFLTQATGDLPPWVGRGQCVEHYGAGEAYLPILEALGRLGRGRDGTELIAGLRQYAPTWLVQMPALCRPDVLEALHHTLQGVTHARMLRELADVLDALAAVRPVLVVLEDLHWSDASTVEALALLARRRDTARLMVLGTCRPMELSVHAHPLKLVQQELLARGQCAEVPLRGLDQAAVAAYLSQRGAVAEPPAALTAFVHRRTEGHPLFMVQVVDYLAHHGALQAGALGPLREAVEREVPQGLQQLIEAQVGRLRAEEQQVLEVGSVAGAEFAAASVAAGLQTTPEAIETVCEGLARQGQFLEDRGLAEWPDGTVSGCYGFRHTLYQEVVYQRIGTWRRARMHRRLGAREEVGYGARVHEIAAALAMHFERGGDPQRAVRYHQQAAEQALRRYAYHEAVEHLTTALTLLDSLPQTPERSQHELALQMALGSAAMAAHGETAPTVEQAYARACVLCQQVGAISQLCAALVGLGTTYATGGQLSRARELLKQALHYGQEAHDPADHARAAVMLGSVTFLGGDFVTARTHLEEGQRLYTPQLQRFHANASPAFGLTRLAEVLWHLGYPDQALQRSDEALRLARLVAHPWEMLVALIFAANVHQYRREVSQTRALAEEALTLAREQGFGLRFAQAQMQYGWALVMQGHGAEGMGQLQQGSIAYRARATAEATARYIALEAEAYGRLGEPSTGLQRLMAVMADLPPGVDRYNQAELLRLRGDLLLQEARCGLEARHHAQMETAETLFRQALTLARRQHAKTPELRAARSLSRLWQQQGKQAEAQQLLAAVYDWFTEGFDTADLQAARVLLRALDTPPIADAASRPALPQ